MNMIKVLEKKDDGFKKKRIKNYAKRKKNINRNEKWWPLAYQQC